jgi:hypothetical protein
VLDRVGPALSRRGRGLAAVMTRADDYRKYAEECRSLAKKMEHENERNWLLEMAKAWEKLAKARDARGAK